MSRVLLPVAALTVLVGLALDPAACAADASAAKAGKKIAFPGVPYAWTATPLAEPKGKVVRVSNAGELRKALRNGAKDTSVLLADGTYRLEKPIFLGGTRNLTIRSASGNRDAVVIQGPGMKPDPGKPKFSALNWTKSSSGLLLADLTVRDFRWHGVHVGGGKDVRIYNCRFLDMGQQHIKVNGAAEKGVLEYCLIEYTDRLWGGNYTQGISVNSGQNWTVRHCVFRNIRGAKGAGMGGPAILMWGDAKHMAAVGNVLIDCDAGIAFGIGRSRRRPYHLTDGLIAGNVFVRNQVEKQSDYGISISACKDVRVLHNTVWNPCRKGGIKWSCEYRFDCDGLLFANNLSMMGLKARKGKHTNIQTRNNVASKDASWFVDVAKYDLHLTGKAAGALGKGAALKKDGLSPAIDVDGDARPAESADVGGDQRQASVGGTGK